MMEREKEDDHSRERTPEEREGDPGTIILFNNVHDVDLVLKLPAVTNTYSTPEAWK